MKSKGFRQIDTQYFLALLAADLTRAASKVLLTVIHFTLGYGQRDTADISLTTFQNLTKLSRPAVKAAIRELIAYGMITLVRQGSTDKQPVIYNLNTNFETWTGKAGLPSTGEVGLPSEMSKTYPVDAENLPSTGQVPTPTTQPIKKERKPLKKGCAASITTGTTKKDNNSQGDIPLKPSSKTTRKLSSNPYIAQLQEYLGFPGKTAVDPVPSPGKEAKAIKRMLDRGLTWEKIFACWKAKVTEHSGDFVSMTWVNEDIGKKGGQGRAYRKSSRELPPRDSYTRPEDIRT